MHQRRLDTPLVVAGFALIAASLAAAQRPSPRFYDDDPLWIVRDTQDASQMQPLEVTLGVDLGLNLFAPLGDPARNVRAKNLNTVDEVPDSSWFTNRAGRRALTAAEIARGPDTTTGPPPGPWTIVSAKIGGVTPGFTVRDGSGTYWFLKFDPPGHRAMMTGTEVVVTKLMWALGYHVPENYIAALRLDQLTIAESTTVQPPGERKRRMRMDDVTALLERGEREPDGTYRVVASKGLEGKPIGRLRFYGTRPDDPNDTVPHEHRRELRGYGVFSAWLNHVDAKAGNTQDMLIAEKGRSHVRHNIIDFGSTLGSAGTAPRQAWEGHEYVVEIDDALKGIPSFGFFIRPWRTIEMYEAPAIGRLPKDNARFDPDAWKPRVPNQAFLRARADDKFWAATKLAALTDELVRAAVATGRFGDEAAEQFLVRALIERRDAILRAYLPAINPISAPELDAGGELTFRNAAADARVAKAPDGYAAVWSSFDNFTHESRLVGETSGATPRLRAPDGLPSSEGAFIHVEIRATGASHPSWSIPVHAYFRRTSNGWKLVGFERTAVRQEITSSRGLSSGERCRVDEGGLRPPGGEAAGDAR